MSTFYDIFGNEAVKSRLEKMLQSGRIPHLLLFHGNEGIGKCAFASAFAKKWLGEKCLDLHILRPEGKSGMHSIRSVKRLLETLQLSPFEATGKVAIIDDAERMLPTSANALLKILEEPPVNTLIILVSSHPEKLLGTIFSRAQKIAFRPLRDEEIMAYFAREKKELPPDILHRSRGSIGRACILLQEPEDDLERRLFDLLLSLSNRNFYEIVEKASSIQKHVEEKRKNKEELLRSDFKEVSKELSSATKELLELELDGAVILSWWQDIDRILQGILSFYRDLTAISCNTPLFFSHRKDQIITSYNQGRTMPLEKVEELLSWAKLSLERSMPLQNVLETLSLQLQ